MYTYNLWTQGPSIASLTSNRNFMRHNLRGRWIQNQCIVLRGIHCRLQVHLIFAFWNMQSLVFGVFSWGLRFRVGRLSFSFSDYKFLRLKPGLGLSNWFLWSSIFIRFCLKSLSWIVLSSVKTWAKTRATTFWRVVCSNGILVLPKLRR